MSAVRLTPYHMSFLILSMLLIYPSGSVTLLIFSDIRWILYSYGLDVTDIVLSDFMISDHKPILFTLSLSELSHFSHTTVSLSRFYSPQFNTNFNLCFAKCCSKLHLDQPLSDLDADLHLSLLNSAWLKAANATAPLKPHKQKLNLYCGKTLIPVS